jgi:hypothetical protein
MALDALTLEHFAPHLGKTFRVTNAAETALTLVEAAPIASPGSDQGRRAAFALLFRGPLTPWLPQAIYGFEHPGGDVLEFFIVPVGPDKDGMRYEAIFN